MDDLAVPQHHRSGAHRARRHPVLVFLATVVSVAVASAVLVWGLLTFDVLGVGDELLDAGVVPDLGRPVAQPSTDEVPTGEPSAEASQPPAGPGTVPADRSLPLAVLNATTTPGLASTAAEELTSEGWTVETVGNYGGGATSTSVLYTEDSQLATAEALAEVVGAEEVTRSDEVDQLTVVLGPDYAG